MSNVNRRDFVKVLAVFGSAMALPERLKASQPLPPPQQAIILPPSALDTVNKHFLWINRVPVTEAYQFDLRVEMPVAPSFRLNGGEYTALVQQQGTLRIEVAMRSEGFSRLFGHILNRYESSVEIAFMLPNDTVTNIVDGYCTNLTTRLTDRDVDVIQVEFQGTSPRQISAQQLPKYLAGKL